MGGRWLLGGGHGPPRVNGRDVPEHGYLPEMLVYVQEMDCAGPTGMGFGQVRYWPRTHTHSRVHSLGLTNGPSKWESHINARCAIRAAWAPC